MNTLTRNHTMEYTLDGLPELVLTNHRGDVHVRHDAAPGEVRITLTSNEPVDFDAVQSWTDGNRVTVTIPALPVDGTQNMSTLLGVISWAVGRAGVTVDADVHCAPDAHLTLETHQGDIVIQGTSGRTAAKTGSGDIVADACESTVMSTGSGDISVHRVGAARLNTGSGDVSVERCSDVVDIHTASGDVHVGSSNGQLKIVTGSGDVHAAVNAGSAEVRTGMGDVTVQVPPGVAVWQDLTTGIGEVRSNVQPHGEPEPDEPYVSVTARTGAGDVSLIA